MKKILVLLSLVLITGCTKDKAKNPYVPVDPLKPSGLTYNISSKVLRFQIESEPLYPSYYGSVVTNFSISPALPTGLQFSELSGRIAGTPEALSAPVEYTITATNDNGVATTKVILSVVHQEPFGLNYGTELFVSTVNNQMNLLPACNDGIRLGAQCTSFSITPALPGFLSFNTTNGRIAGTITSKFTQTYTITGHNSGGSVSVDLVIDIRDFINKLTLGAEHSCAMVNDQVKCWGNNEKGQLGDGTFFNRLTPVNILYSGSKFSQISAGYDFSCAYRFDNNETYCWGNNTGQFGPTAGLGLQPSPVTTNLFISKISSSSGSSLRRLCGVNDDTNGVCYGNYSFGTLASSNYRVATSGVNYLTSVENTNAGGDFSCFIRQGRVYCNGSNDWGQLGDNQASGASSVNLITPTDLAGSVTSLDTHGKSACAIKNRNALYCWGEINGETEPTEIAVNIPDIISLESVVVGNDFLCVINSGKVYCRGNNSFGQLGSGSAAPSSLAFEEVLKASDNSSLGTAFTLDAGDYHACAIVSNSVYCWGRNNRGQLGNNTNTNSSRAVSLSF